MLYRPKFHSSLPEQNFVGILISHICATCLSHLMFLDSNILMFYTENIVKKILAVNTVSSVITFFSKIWNLFYRTDFRQNFFLSFKLEVSLPPINTLKL
jgi:hypothetical protein